MKKVDDKAGQKVKEQNKEKLIEIKDSEYQKLKDEVAEYKDKYLRLFAEFENARKRNEREKIEFVKYANEGLISEFLNVLDDLERSVQAAQENHKDYSAFLEGIELVMAQIHEMLKQNNVKKMETVGKKFDPHCHEVLMQEESAQYEDGMVIEEFQKGYIMGDRVVRTAKVKVAVNNESNKEEK